MAVAGGGRGHADVRAAAMQDRAPWQRRELADFSKSAIIASRLACRGSRENGVATKAFANSSAASSLYIRAPRLSTLASLCCLASWAVSVIQASAARIPGILFEAICSPLPDPPMTMPRLPGLPATARAARITCTG